MLQRTRKGAHFYVTVKIKLTEEECTQIYSILNVSRISLLMSATDGVTVQDLSSNYLSMLDKLEQQSPTSKLAVQYFKMTFIITKFIQTERMRG